MNKSFSFKQLGKFFLATVFLFIGSFAYSQCAPRLVKNDGTDGVTETFCVGEIITFKANSPGYTTTTNWNFGDGVGTSLDQNPTYSYSTPGSYTITFDGNGPLGSCTETLQVVIRPAPEIGIEIVNLNTQCFKDNSFCFRDTTRAPNGNIVKQTWLFSDGTRIDTTFPAGSINNALDITFCHTIMDPSGGNFDLVVESLDSSGCLSRVVYSDFIFVHPRIGAEFNNITPQPNPGCESTLGVFTNISPILLADIDSFRWEWGDGTSIGGNSTTNTEWWLGENNDGVVNHLYNTNGTFDGKLIVEAYGCVDEFVWNSAVTNIVIEPVIVSTPNPACTADNPIQFSVTGLGGAPPVDGFLWNFGDPPAGPNNFNNRTLSPTKAYGPGPWMISLNFQAGPCDLTIYDTVIVIGPGSTIETAFDRVEEDETYQCIISDSVRFPNNSTFYQNDWNPLDEDSFIYYYDFSFDYEFDNTTGTYSLHYREYEETRRGNNTTFDSTYNSTTDTINVNGYKVYRDAAKDSLAVSRLGVTTWHRIPYGSDGLSYRFGVNPDKKWIFNHIPPVGNGGRGTGDQTAINPTVNIRDYNPNVWRVWNMGDQFAPQCTTDSRPWVNKNVGINCNWTVDSTPVHWYTPWDEIYETFQGGTNFTTPITETRLFRNGANSTCYQVNIFPANPMIIPGDTVLTIPIDSTFTYQGVNIPAGVRYPGDKLGNWIVRRPSSILIGAELYWDSVLDTFVAVNNLTDTTYHSEDRLGRNNTTAGNATTTWTPTYFDMDIFIPPNVTIQTLQLPRPGGGGAGVGNRNTYSGGALGRTVTLNAGEQFEISSRDSIIILNKVEENQPVTIAATPTTFPVLLNTNGVNVVIQRSEIFVDSALHRNEWFINNAQCFNVTLLQSDTVHPLLCQSSGTKALALIPPNAEGLQWVAGTPCPFDGNILDYVLTFDLSNTKPGCTQRWFAANLDSLADPNNFIPFDGGLLAPPPPGAPTPFVLPYDVRGNLGTQFVKGYTAGEIGNDPTLRQPNGSFTLGLIVGNGRLVPTPPGSSTMLPECLDTFWYNDLFRILYLNAAFTILDPVGERKAICPGEDAYFQIDFPIQDSIDVMRWAWGYQGIGRGPQLDNYIEQFNYLEEYNGPVPGRNDENVVWNPTDKWLYNYVVRQNLTDFGGLDTIETIVTAIIKDHEIVANTRNADGLIVSLFNQSLGLNYQDLAPEDIPLYLGDGTNGCIDTTGLSSLFQFGIKAFSEKVDPDVWLAGDRRMRCRTYLPAFISDTTFATNPATGAILKSISNPGQDSIQLIDSSANYNRADCIDAYEVTQILHFRDTSLQGYDTLRMDTSGNGIVDIIPGVWKKTYAFPQEIIPDPCYPNQKDTIMVPSNGPMTPTLFLNNKDGCGVRSSALLNVGFLNEHWLENDRLCQGLTLEVNDSIRYYQYGQENPSTYPINIYPFWQDQNRVDNDIEYHEADWGETDNYNFEKAINLTHVYATPGKYDITIVTYDSIGCTDTNVLTAYISELTPDFSFDDQITCEGIVNFSDSSVFVDPCTDTCSDGSILSCENITNWEWDFGDGTRNSLLQNPSHNFTSGGNFDVTLTVWTEFGCEETITKRVYIPGPRPEFDFADDNVNNDTLVICLGDSVFLENLSTSDGTQPSFLMNWGDGNFSNPPSNGDNYGHAYQTADTFLLWLSMSDVLEDGSMCTRTYPDSSAEQLIQIRKVVIVQPRPIVEISVSDTLICPGTEVTFTIDSLDERYERLKWISGKGDTVRLNSTDDRTFRTTYTTPGTYYGVQAPEYDQPPLCWAMDTAIVEVQDVDIRFSIDSTDRPNFCFINESTGTDETKYQWTFEDAPLEGTSNEINPCYNWDNRKGTYQVCLIGESTIGCEDTFCLQVQNSFIRDITPYNVFTPNGDGQNDQFIIDGESLQEYTIKIYNRYGEKVFESTDINRSWNGQVDNTKATCPEGTYFYIINYKFRFGEENEGLGPLEGQVELIRSQ